MNYDEALTLFSAATQEDLEQLEREDPELFESLYYAFGWAEAIVSWHKDVVQDPPV